MWTFRWGMDNPGWSGDRQLLCSKGLTQRGFLCVQGGVHHQNSIRTFQWGIIPCRHGDSPWRSECLCVQCEWFCSLKWSRLFLTFVAFLTVTEQDVNLRFSNRQINAFLLLLCRGPHSSRSDWITWVKGHRRRRSDVKEELQLPVWDQQVFLTFACGQDCGQAISPSNSPPSCFCAPQGTFQCTHLV